MHLLGLAGVGIAKPIRYFESKTKTFDIFDIFVSRGFIIGRCYIGFDYLSYEYIIRIIYFKTNRTISNG